MFKLLFVLFAFAMPVAAFAAEPVVKVSPLPSDERLEIWEESEEIFTEKVMEYYHQATLLYMQAKLSGFETNESIIPPSFEELSDMEIQTIKDYHALAMKYFAIVESMPETGNREEIDRLRKELFAAMNKNNDMEKRQYELALKHNDMEFYRENWKAAREEAAKLNRKLDSATAAMDKYLIQREGEIRATYERNVRRFTPVFSIGGTANKYYIRENGVDDKISFGGQLTFNPEPVFGFGRYFEIFGEYIMPRFTTVQIGEGMPATDKWNSQLYTIGLNFKFDDVIDLQDFTGGIKLGGGHFWGSGKLDNMDYGAANFEGEMIRFEMFVRNADIALPLELFFAYSSYFASDMTFDSRMQYLDLGEPQFNVLTLGVRLALWKTPVYDN